MFKIKTLVELFDFCQVENVIAGLKLRPERIIFVGFKSVMTNNRMKAVKNLFESKFKSIEIIFETVEKHDVDDIVSRFEKIFDKYEDCYFDMTGGRETLLAALGMFMERRNVPVFQFDVLNEKFTGIKNCEKLPEMYNASMTIKEALSLSSSKYIEGDSGDFSWDFNPEFKEDVKKVWKIASDDCGEWNRQSNILDYLDAIKEKIGNLTVSIKGREYPVLNEKIIDGLINAGLIYEFKKSDKKLFFKYKNNQVKRLITKAGNILEVYGGMLIKEIKDELPGYYDDMDISVYIDWDGIIHPDRSGVADTKNEVDIMVMKDLIPIFISCKNGEVHKEALYELDTVAKRFGGKYAKKVLFATFVNNDEKSFEYLMKRAEDMNIKVISGMHDKSDTKLKDDIKKIVK